MTCSRIIALMIVFLLFAFLAAHYVDAQEKSLSAKELSSELKRAEETAQKFIQRWHETLDLNVLFHEMYVTNPQQRRLNAYLFAADYRFLVGASSTPQVATVVDETTLLKGHLAFWNMLYLGEEYNLCCARKVNGRIVEPLGVKKAMQDYKKSLKAINAENPTAQGINLFIEKASRVSASLRKHLPATVFKTKAYREKAQNNVSQIEGYGYKPEIIFGFAEYGVDKNTPVYSIYRGLFHFYFIEEKGYLKVLTLGFEL